MRKFLISIFVLIGIIILIKPVSAISKLHVEGKYIKNEVGNIVFLRGINKATFDGCSDGWWSNGVWTSYGNWNESNVRLNLQAMKDWGFNVLRLHTTIEAWKTNWKDCLGSPSSNMAFKDAIKRTIELASEYGIYIVYDVYNVGIGEGQPLLPWPPYTARNDIISSPQAFVDLWVNVTTELKVYPNVLFELFNEPAGPRDEWFPVVQQSVDAIRNITDHIIIVQHGYSAGFDWLRTYQINGTNILYSNHIYRSLYDYPCSWMTLPNCEYTYDDIKNALWDIRDYRYPLENNLSIWIGETGCWNSSDPTLEEAEYFRNMLQVLNEWEVGYAPWEWFWGKDGVAGRVQGLIAQPWEPDTMPTPNICGQILVDAIAASKGNLTYPVNITGNVTDLETGLPMQNVSVTCNSYRGTTNSTGGYFISISYTGSCDLTASKAGYVSNSTFLSFPENGTYTYNFALELIPPITYIIAGRLKDKNDNPVNGRIIIFQQGTDNVITTNQTDSNGNYNVSISPGTYDIQFNLTGFYIPNYYIKIPSVDVSSDVYDIIKYVTGYPSENKVSIVIGIDNPQTIQTYSETKPTRVLQNNTPLANVSLLSNLNKNKWFYESNKLYLIATPWIIPVCGNNRCETGEDNSNCPTDCLPELDLLGYWKFDEKSGNTAFDSSGNGNNGTINGAIWELVNCRYDSCLNFNSTGYIMINSFGNFSNGFTIELWFNTKQGDQRLFWSTNFATAYLKPTSNEMVAFIGNGSGWDGAMGASGWEFNVWTHFAMTYNKTTGAWFMYRNGNVVVSSSSSVTMRMTNPFYIGMTWAPFAGIIDEVRIYNRTLGAEEISAHVLM